MVPASIGGVFQAMLLGSLVSIVSRRKMGMLMGKPFKEQDVVFLKELLETGQVSPVIDRSYPLSEVPEALRYQEEGHTRGKIVITI